MNTKLQNPNVKKKNKKQQVMKKWRKGWDV